MIERLDPRSESDATQIADLHSRYLGDSPIVQFGPAFLRRFFYRSLVRDGLVGASLYRHEGRVVGFISYTTEPLGFMKKGILRHPLQLGWALLSGVVQRPATAIDIAKILKVMRERQGEVFAGHISGVTDFGLFVRLDELSVDGMVHISELVDDYYRYEDRGHRLVGERNGRMWRLGDPIEVRLVRVDLDAMQLQLVPVGMKPDARAARKPGRRRR